MILSQLYYIFFDLDQLVSMNSQKKTHPFVLGLNNFSFS
jgi:hypothetical protein